MVINFMQQFIQNKTNLFQGIMQNVEQIQCVLWPDGGSPSSTSVLLDLIHHSNEVLDDEAGTIIVHCSAGVGRTGTFIGLYKLIQDFLDKDVKILDPFETVLEMRKQRMKMVQKPMQYHYMIKCLADFVAEESTEVVSFNLLFNLTNNFLCYLMIHKSSL